MYNIERNTTIRINFIILRIWVIKLSGFEKRTEEKKEKVLEVTFELMNRGVDNKNITMECIAKHANVAKSTIFKYFGSKEKLIHEVYKNFINEMAEEAKAIMDENSSFEEKMIAMSQSEISFLDKINKSFYMNMMQYLTEKDDDGLSVIMQKYNEESINIMLDLFHQGRKEGKVDLKYSDEFLLLYFQAIIEGISSPQVYKKANSYTEELMEMILKSFAPTDKE